MYIEGMRTFGRVDGVFSDTNSIRFAPTGLMCYFYSAYKHLAPTEPMIEVSCVCGCYQKKSQPRRGEIFVELFKKTKWSSVRSEM